MLCRIFVGEQQVSNMLYRSTKEQFVLGPQQAIMYTWDDPAGTRLLWWCVLGDQKCTRLINLSQVIRTLSLIRYLSWWPKIINIWLLYVNQS